MLNKNEFLTDTQTFTYFDVNNKEQSMILNQDMLAFTICQVPVIYIKSNEQKIIITTRDGNEEEIMGFEISSALSKSIFQREDLILKIRVMVEDVYY